MKKARCCDENMTEVRPTAINSFNLDGLCLFVCVFVSGSLFYKRSKQWTNSGVLLNQRHDVKFVIWTSCSDTYNAVLFCHSHEEVSYSSHFGWGDPNDLTTRMLGETIHWRPSRYGIAGRTDETFWMRGETSTSTTSSCHWTESLG